MGLFSCRSATFLLFALLFDSMPKASATAAADEGQQSIQVDVDNNGGWHILNAKVGSRV